MVGISCCEGWVIEEIVGLDDEGDIRSSSESVDEAMVGPWDGDVVVSVLPVVFYVC